MDNRSPTPDEEASMLALESSLDVVYVSDMHAYYLAGQLNHYQATGDPVISTGNTHVRVNFLRKQRLSYEIYAQWLFDHSRHLNLRYLSGGGIKYRLFKTDIFEFDIGTGAFYEYEKWGNLARDGSQTINEMIKSSSYIKSNIDLSDQVNLAFVSFYQFGYDQDIEEVRQRISGQLQLEFNISAHFAFVIEGNIHYENKPVIPINKTIFGIQNGLRYDF
ncbi:DUF481 domain-containing protein [Reichenbachiella carrageenanivorans]|uniref:DUF481 domain-containing protein n=1 Tax=Reichenbachiella carrageenanivorans TaxID=2979869 RepID=A0ABY6CWD7_9BACT|nr:DUF481 domain-containing protein [Reichenbachiella carrageenanivorans]UXX78236.1 DUF481 domain-containing protein [Reichenbachiella carrageenanivorans]